LLQTVLEEEGSLSGVVIDERDNMPSSSLYRSRFGSLLRAYTLIGYLPDRDYRYVEINRALRQSYPKFLAEVTAGLQTAGAHVFCDPVSELLFINNEFTASLVIARSLETLGCCLHLSVPSAPNALFNRRADEPRRFCLCLCAKYATQRLHGGLEFIHRRRTGFGLVAVLEHEKIVCNLRRNLCPDQAITAPAAFPLVCDHAPTGVRRIATEHLLNFVEAQPNLSH